jgi:protein-disulfide isomerase
MRNLLWLAAVAALSIGNASPAAAQSYKTSGSPSAPLALEVYTDYECPHCKAFYEETIPSFIVEFVNTGKARLVHRDFPITSIHQYAGLAARYANAAGEIGKYDIVVNQLFRTQDEWGQNGNVDAAVMKVLPPGDMQKVRDMVKNDPKLDETVAKDVAMAANTDHLTGTPTLVIVYKGQRDVINGGVPYVTLKSYLNAKLGK